MTTLAATPKLRSINRLFDLLDEYKESVKLSRLAPSSKTDYVLFAEMFVRWCEGTFEPGETL